MVEVDLDHAMLDHSYVVVDHAHEKEDHGPLKNVHDEDLDHEVEGLAHEDLDHVAEDPGHEEVDPDHGAGSLDHEEVALVHVEVAHGGVEVDHVHGEVVLVHGVEDHGHGMVLEDVALDHEKRGLADEMEARDHEALAHDVILGHVAACLEYVEEDLGHVVVDHLEMEDHDHAMEDLVHKEDSDHADQAHVVVPGHVVVGHSFDQVEDPNFHEVGDNDWKDQIHDGAYSYAHCRPRMEDYHEAHHVVVAVLRVVIRLGAVLVGNFRQREVVPEPASARHAEKSAVNWAKETQWPMKTPQSERSAERGESGPLEAPRPRKASRKRSLTSDPRCSSISSKKFS